MITERATLEMLIKFANKQAEKLFRVQQQLLPMYHAVTASGQQLVFNSPSRDKDEAVRLIKAEFVARDVLFYVFMDEAWWLGARGAEYRKLDMNAINRDGLQYHPDRREIVMFSAEHRNGEMLMAHRYILRPEHGKATLSPLGKIESFDHSAGRMVGLLRRDA